MKAILSDSDTGTITAALRLYQLKLFERDGCKPTKLSHDDLELIATDDGKLAPLTADEIDGLCERLNAGETAVDRMEREDPRGEHPEFGREDWGTETALRSTQLGYWDWVRHRVESEEG